MSDEQDVYVADLCAAVDEVHMYVREGVTFIVAPNGIGGWFVNSVPRIMPKIRMVKSDEEENNDD